MKKVKKIIAAIALCTIATSVMGCKMIEKTPEAIAKTTIAKVGNEKITKGDFDLAFAQSDMMFKQYYGEDYASNAQLAEQLAQYKEQCLNQLVEQSVLLQKAEEQKLMPSDKEIEDKFKENMEPYTGSGIEEAQFNEFLKTYGFKDKASFEEYQKKQAKIELIYNKIVKDVNVTDEDIQKYYDENKETKYTSEGDVDFDKSLKKANEIEAELKAGSDFTTLAKEKSDDPSAETNGGDLGFTEYNDTKFVQEFMDGFKNLKEGEISEPVKSQFGYHIIKVTGVTDKGANVAHILAAEKGESTVTPLEDVKDSIKSEIENQKKSEVYKAKIEELKKSMNIKTYKNKI